MPHFHVRSFWSREAKTKIVAVAQALNKFHKGGVHSTGRIPAEASGDCTARTNCLEARPIFVRGRPLKPTLPSFTYSSVRSSSLARPLSERVTPAVRSLATVGCTERKNALGTVVPYPHGQSLSADGADQGSHRQKFASEIPGDTIAAPRCEATRMPCNFETQM